MRTLFVSTRNSIYQVLQSLRSNRQKRHRTRTFLAEGVLPITRALEHGWTFEAVAYARSARRSEWALDVLARAGAPVRYEVAPELFASLCGRDEGSELLAVIRMKGDDPQRIRMGTDLLVTVADAPASPGNLGTLVRSCDALGCHGVFVGGHAADVYDPSTISASRGSIFAVPVVRAAGPADLAGWLSDVRQALGSCRIVGADEKADVPLAAQDFSGPTVLVFGNETRGLGRAYRQLCDTLVRIPMTGSATSLNLAVAASIVLYEVGRQRMPPSGMR